MRHVIIGNSAAGTAAAKEIRKQQEDAEILMLTADGAFFSRPQLHRVAAGEKEPDQIRFLPSDWAEHSRVAVRFRAIVEAIDAEARVVRLVDGEALPYDRVLIATGSRTFFPPIPGLAGPGSFGLRTLDDAVAIRAAVAEAERVAIIGAGLIGCELGGALAAHGKAVDVVELAAHPLPMQLNSDTGAICARHLEGQGLRLHCGEKVAAVLRDGAEGPIRGVRLASGTELPCSVVVCAAGVRANVELAREAGVAINQRVLIDARGHTNVKHVYAAGDVTEFTGENAPCAIWPSALAQGKVAGINMAGGEAVLEADRALRVNSMLCGVKFTCIGLTHDPGGWTKRVEAFEDKHGQPCMEVFYQDRGVPMGVILWGDNKKAAAYQEAIRSGMVGVG